MLPEERVAKERTSPWVDQEAEVAITQEVRTDVRVPGMFELADVQLDIKVMINGAPTHHHVKSKMGGLKVADVPTMTYPTGFVVLDAETWTVDEEPTWARTIRRGFLSNSLGDLVQFSFDISSIGKLDGELMNPGDIARGLLIGSLQVEGNQTTLTFPTVFELQEGEEGHDLVMRSAKPVSFNLDALKRQDRVGLIKEVLKVRSIDSQVFFEFEMRGTPTTGELPMFARTPVTMASAEKMKRDLDESNNEFDRLKKAMIREGADIQLPDSITREDFEAVRDAMEHRRRTTRITGSMPQPSKPKPTGR